MRRIWMVLFVAAACKGTPSETDLPINCALEQTAALQSVAVPDWPAGLEEALLDLEALDGRWTADACGTQVNISLRTPNPANRGTLVDVVTTPLAAGNRCGCTIDKIEAKDGDLSVIAYTTMDVAVQNYPNEGFREEAAGNVAEMPTALFAGSGGLLVRACATQLVPPVLGLPWTDTDVVFRSGSAGVSGDVRMFGENIGDDSCPLTNWVRVGDN